MNVLHAKNIYTFSLRHKQETRAQRANDEYILTPLA